MPILPPTQPIIRPIIEPAIAMLKPDAWERGVAEDVLARLQAAGLVEERRCEVQLSADDVRALFLHPLPEYIAQLTSRPVSLHLLRGPGGPERLYACKWAIRKEWGFPDRNRNLIHGADEGTEYHLLLSRFFPDVPVPQYCGAADLDLRFPPGTSLRQAEDILAGLDADSTLIWVTVTLQPGNAHLAALIGSEWKRLQLSFAVLISPPDTPYASSFLVHAREGEDPAALLESTSSGPAWGTWKANARPVTLADLRIPASALSRYADDLRTPGCDIDIAVSAYPLMDFVHALQERGVTRFNVYNPRLSLMETELRGDLARLAGLHSSGGSSGLAEAGFFSVSQYSVGGLGMACPAPCDAAA